MYVLIRSGQASMMELCDYYTLEEALKLYALQTMNADIEAAKISEMGRR